MNPATVLLLHKAVVLSKLADRVYGVTPADAGVYPAIDAQMDARVRGHDGVVLVTPADAGIMIYLFVRSNTPSNSATLVMLSTVVRKSRRVALCARSCLSFGPIGSVEDAPVA